MTLQIHAPNLPPALPAATRAPAGLPIGVTVTGHLVRTRPISELLPANVVTTTADDRLDAIARRLYASAGIGVAIASIAAGMLYALNWPVHTRTGQLLFMAIVLGAVMFTGGITTGSLLARPAHGGTR